MISAPDTAVGRKARCPECGTVVAFPNGSGEHAPALGGPAAELAAAVQQVAAGPASDIKAKTPSPSLGAATTTLERLAARTSPYGAARLMAALIFGVGVVLGVITFLVGLAGLIVISMQGHPMIGVLAFVGSLALAVLFVLGARAATELLRLASDIGDRTRQISQYLDENENR
jgi:hypothetical protein